MMMTNKGVHLVLLIVLVYAIQHETEALPHASLKSRVIELLTEISKLSRNQHHTRNLPDYDAKAEKWLKKNDQLLGEKSHEEVVASWNYMTDLTDANAKKTEAIDVAVAKWRLARLGEVKKLLSHKDQMKNETAIRELEFWEHGSSPEPKDPKLLEKLNKALGELSSIYGKAELHKDGKVYRMEPELTELMTTSRDYDELLWAWKGWRDATGPKMKPVFKEAIRIMAIAAKENGYKDYGEAWRISNYDKDNIVPMVDELYQELLPMYQQLHAFVRHRLVAKYGADKVNATGPIPAHLLGNMWAQQWDILDLVTPFPQVPSTDVTPTMLKQGYTPHKMFKLAEEFFMSIGLEPMVPAFWKKSMIKRPTGREVQCHASAEDFMNGKDFRIKMCTKVDMDYLQTIHHEMGHIEYFMQYRHQPIIFRTGANSAFHEAIGDTIALSVLTPKHLRAINLLDKEKKAKADKKDASTGMTEDEMRTLNYLMSMAVKKIAFLPFGYLMDKWRWDVFSGKVDETNYNSRWWEDRVKYQGVEAPVPRSEHDFDPGAKYHIAAFVPYIRYFLSFQGQFQFQKALCTAAGETGPLHECDIYRSRAAGDLLKSALHLGHSRPWPEVMKILTGQEKFVSSAVINYFKPLLDWITKENQKNNVHVGW